ncbi:MFS transporter [Candidatus Bipolaricaulota bacterium]
MFWRFRLYGFLKNLRFFDPFLILFFREMGFSFLDIGVLYAIREIATNILEIPTGVLADAFGRRKAMLASFTAYIVSFALFYAVPRFWAYALAMILFALGETFRSGTHKAMILEHLRLNGLETEKVAYYGRTRAASQFGSAIASLIAAALVFCVGGYRIVFLASTIPYALGLLLFLTYPKALDGERNALAGSVSQRALQQLRLTTTEFLSTLRRRALLRGLFSSAGFDAVFKSSKDYLQPILQAQALALPILLTLDADRRVAIVVGVLYFLIYLVTCFASSRAGCVAQRLRSLPRAANATFALGLALLAAAGAAAWGRVPGVAIAGFLLLFAIQNLRRPILVGYLSDLMPHRTMATGLSVETQLRTLLMAGVAPLLGFLADRFGVGTALLILAAAAFTVFPFVRVKAGEHGP